MHTVQQLVDYLNAHGAPRQLVDQARNLQVRHMLNARTFQDLCNRTGWRPRGVRVDDAVRFVREGVRR